VMLTHPTSDSGSHATQSRGPKLARASSTCRRCQARL
jgi:hypothetical protein